MDNFIDYGVWSLVLLTILVFFHELGHFIVARYNNVRVEVFSVGFGPEVFGFNDQQGTRWKFSAIPLGGYVKMFGEGEFTTDDSDKKERELSEAEKKVSFHHKRLGQRAAIVFAGPLANFILAAVVISGLFSVTGLPNPLSGIGTVQPNSPAEKAGLLPNDRIIMVEGQEIKWFKELREIIENNPNIPMSMEVLRDNKQLTFKVTPSVKIVKVGDLEKEIGLLGVTPNQEMLEYTHVGPIDAILLGSERTYNLTSNILSAVGQMITGEVSRADLGGPIRIFQISGQMAEAGMASWWFFLAALSINLGLINLFPIPMLDGGHLLFYFFEAILGRPINKKAQEYSFRFGLFLVLLLMVFATWNDLVQLKIFEYFSNFTS